MMKRTYLPVAIVGVAVVTMMIHGPIGQLPHYHEFADQSGWFGIPHAADVLSNLGFAAVAMWGAFSLWPARHGEGFKSSIYGYALFIAGLLLTAFGSSFYHLAPDNARLVWDRLPIALACVGLLGAVRAETHAGEHPVRDVLLLGAFAVFSVAWWRFTDLRGADDLRPYLLLQGLPLMLIPLWQWIYGAPRADKMAFMAAISLYVAAKAAELNDHEILAALGWMSGHTLKHLLSTLAAGVIVGRLVQRADREAMSSQSARVEKFFEQVM